MAYYKAWNLQTNKVIKAIISSRQNEFIAVTKFLLFKIKAYA